MRDLLGGQALEPVDLGSRERDVASQTRGPLQSGNTDATGATTDSLVLGDQCSGNGVDQRLSSRCHLCDLDVDRRFGFDERGLQGATFLGKIGEDDRCCGKSLVEGLDPFHELEDLVLQRRLSSLQRFEIGLERLRLLGGGQGAVVQLLVDVSGLALHRGDLILEAALLTSEAISFGAWFGDLLLERRLSTIEFGDRSPLRQRRSPMAQLVGRRVIGLEIQQSLEVTHRLSLTRTRPGCRIDQLIGGEGGFNVVVVEDVVDVDDVEEVEDVDGRVVLVPDRVVVVVDFAVVVVVVDSVTVNSAPLRMP